MGHNHQRNGLSTAPLPASCMCIAAFGIPFLVVFKFEFGYQLSPSFIQVYSNPENRWNIKLWGKEQQGCTTRGHQHEGLGPSPDSITWTILSDSLDLSLLNYDRKTHNTKSLLSSVLTHSALLPEDPLWAKGRRSHWGRGVNLSWSLYTGGGDYHRSKQMNEAW